MDVRRCADCGNSPKNVLAESFAVAIFGAQAEAARQWLAANAVLELVGSLRLNGRDEIVARLRTADRLEIDLVTTHGRAGAVAGVVTRQDRPAPFAMTLRFATAAAHAVALVQIYTPAPEAFFPD